MSVLDGSFWFVAYSEGADSTPGTLFIQLLFWLEVMSVLNRIQDASILLQRCRVTIAKVNKHWILVVSYSYNIRQPLL
jgi:hypothetical protein